MQGTNWKGYKQIINNVLNSNGYTTINPEILKTRFHINLMGQRLRLENFLVLNTSEGAIVVRSCWQEKTGSTWKKTSHFILEFMQLMRTYKEIKACYIIVGGPDWNNRLSGAKEFYLSNDWRQEFVSKDAQNIHVLDSEQFMAKVLNSTL